MRNLKKLLSVVLVVAMIAGLCAVGSFSAAAAEYSETTNYKEAAAVITGVGVMDGYEDGTMQYDKTVTREEAAAIICRALIGVDTAKKLSTAVAPFADVAANRWSAPYINYLKSQGIVNGKTATQFDPTAEVTAVEFAKMMLCSVGYGKAGEFVGASWDVNTITAANNNGIFTGTLAADLTAPATREQCMLYAFNTMVRVPVVSYNTAFQSYYVGTSITSGIDSRVPEDLIGNAGGLNNPYNHTLAYRNFKLELANNNGKDDYGRPTVKWTANSKTIAEDVCSKTPNYVLTGNVANSTIYNTISAGVAKNINKQIYNESNGLLYKGADKVVELWINGVQQSWVSTTPPGGMTTTSIGPITTAFAGDSLMSNKVAGYGDTVEIYVDTFETKPQATGDDITTAVGDYKLTIVVTSEFFGQVTAVSANKLTVSVKTHKVTGIYPNTITAKDEYNVTVKSDDVNISGFAKKDYVLLNMSNPGTTAKVTKVIAAKAPVVGSYGGTNAMLQYIIDGNGVSASVVTSGTVNADGELVSGNQYSFWYDSLGNVIFAELYQDSGTSDVSKYAYLRNIRCATTDYKYDYDFEVQLVYSDGKSEWVHYNVDPTSGAYKFDNNTFYVYDKNGDYYKVSDAKVTKNISGNVVSYSGDHAPAGINGLSDQFINGFYTYTKADNKVVLKKIDNAFARDITATQIEFNPNTGAKATAGNTSFAANYASNSSTKVTIVDASGSVITFNGESKFNNEKYTGDVLYTFDKNSTKIKHIFLMSNATLKETSKAFFVGADHSESDYAYVNLYIDGSYVEKAKVDLKNLAFAQSSGYKVFDVEKTGDLYTLSTATNIVNNNNTKFAAVANKNDGFGYFDFDKFQVTYHYAWATIDTVDNHAFWTAEADKGSNEAGASATDVGADKYYFDSSTQIYDCTFAGGGKLVNGIEAGQYFIADVTTTNNTYNGQNYCKTIWIVD